jgi:D-alanyl-D-alanine carboxypeptidase
LAAGGAISTADDLSTWMRALVGGKVFNSDYQGQWLGSLEPQDPAAPDGQKYGYGISQISFGPNHVYFHGGEMPGYNSFMGYDPVNDVTLIIWTSLTVALDGKPTANTIMLQMLDQIYAVSPLQQKQ